MTSVVWAFTMSCSSVGRAVDFLSAGRQFDPAHGNKTILILKTEDYERICKHADEGLQT